MLSMRRFFAGIAPLVLASTIAHAAPPAPPTMDNKAWLLVDATSGQVLAEHNAHQRLEPASLTKMMTSYLVEQALTSGRIKENDPVFVSEYAWCRGTSAESCMYLPVNSYAAVIDMLRGVIIQSGNDASKALAEHLGGNEPAFAEMMNKEAARLGMKNTHFMNATGLPDPQHMTTAFDMAILARAIIRDSSHYYPIYAEKSFTFNGIKQGNRNALLYTDPTVDGLKTGHTNAAGYCLVSSSKRSDMRLIAVVMGANSMQARADQSRALFNWGFAHFENANPVAANSVLLTPRIWFGQADSVKAGVIDGITLTLPRGEKERLSTTIELDPELRAPLSRGQKIGDVILSVDGKQIAIVPLQALEPVEEANFMVRVWHYIKRFFVNLF